MRTLRLKMLDQGNYSERQPLNLLKQNPTLKESAFWFSYSTNKYLCLALVDEETEEVILEKQAECAMELIPPNNAQSDVCVTFARQEKGLYWFRSIRTFVFGTILMRFSVPDVATNVLVNERPESIVYEINVSRDCDGNRPVETSFATELEKEDILSKDYLKLLDRDDVVISTSDNGSKPRSSSRNSKGKHSGRGSSTYSEDKNEKQHTTRYDEDFLAKPRISFGGRKRGSPEENSPQGDDLSKRQTRGSSYVSISSSSSSASNASGGNRRGGGRGGSGGADAGADDDEDSEIDSDIEEIGEALLKPPLPPPQPPMFLQHRLLQFNSVDRNSDASTGIMQRSSSDEASAAVESKLHTSLSSSSSSSSSNLSHTERVLDSEKSIRGGSDPQSLSSSSSSSSSSSNLSLDGRSAFASSVPSTGMAAVHAKCLALPQGLLACLELQQSSSATAR